MEPALLALLAGLLHHFVLQYPKQAAMSTTFYGFCLSNFVFLVSQFRTLADASTILLTRTQFFFRALFVFDLVYISSALLWKVVYNVYFRHRGIPTTFWLSATDWAFWKEIQTGVPHKMIEDLHKKLGDVIRIQPNHICFNDAKAFEEIYGLSAPTRKGAFYSMVGGKSRKSIFTETSRHAFLRRLIGSSFSASNLKTFETTITPYYKALIQNVQDIADKNDGIVDMNVQFVNFTFEVAGALALGLEFGNLHSAEKHFFMKRMHQILVFMNMISSIPWASQILRPLPMPKFLTGKRGTLRTFTSKLVAETIERNKENPGRYILSNMLKAKDPATGEKLGFDDLVANAQTLLCGASDTTAIGLTYAMYFIASDRRVWKRLSSEIREQFNSVDEITGQSTEFLTFLVAVICEALRLYPPVTAIHPRVTPPEGMVITGRFVAGNTWVSTPNWTLEHNSKYFSNPYSFIPERWIEAERGNETCVKEAWQPFLNGRWSCLGKPLGLMSLRIVLAKLVWTYDFELKEGQGAPSYLHRSLSAGPLQLKVKRVERVAV